MSAQAPVSDKVGNGTLVGSAAALVSWALTYFIPAWHSGIPAPLQALIPGVVAAAGYFIAGYRSTHSATVAEVTTAVRDAIAIQAAAQEHPNPDIVAPLAGQTSPAGGANASR